MSVECPEQISQGMHIGHGRCRAHDRREDGAPLYQPISQTRRRQENGRDEVRVVERQFFHGCERQQSSLEIWSQSCACLNVVSPHTGWPLGGAIGKALVEWNWQTPCETSGSQQYLQKE